MVSIRKIEAVVTAMNGGDESGLKGRLQYLNLQHFPPGFRVGKAKRADYGMDEVLAFSLWFSLCQASMTPIAAIALVSDFWPELARLYLTAASRAGVLGISSGSGDATVGIITGNALKASAKANPDDLRGPARPFDIRSSTRDALAKSLGSGFDARIVMDFDAIHEAIAAAMPKEPGPVAEAQFNEEIGAFARREGWAPPVTGDAVLPPPHVRPIVPESRGQRLSEADYYYSRALELIGAIEKGGAKRLKASPRLNRAFGYLMDPSPREEWKRWVQVGETGIAFMWAMAALVEEATDIKTNIPETIIDGVGGRMTRDFNHSLLEMLRETSLKARGYELVGP